MAGEYQLKHSPTGQRDVAAVFDNDEYIQQRATSIATIYNWSCDLEDLPASCRTLFRQARANPGLTRAALYGVDGAPRSAYIPEIYALLKEDGIAEVAGRITMRYVSDVELGIHWQGGATPAEATAKYYNRRGRVHKPSISDLIAATGSFMLRRACPEVIPELDLAINRIIPDQGRPLTVVPLSEWRQ